LFIKYENSLLSSACDSSLLGWFNSPGATCRGGIKLLSLLTVEITF